MKILYASNILSNKEFKRVYNMCKSKPLQSIQKFNKLMCEGLVQQENIDLEILSSAPVNRNMCKKIFWRSKKEKENNIKYNYCFMINFPIIKFITLFFSSLCISLNWCIRNIGDKNKIVIYDAYCPIIANTAAIIANIFKIKVLALYTDVPKYIGANLNKQKSFKMFFKKIYNFIEKFSNKISSGYILLTEQMNELVNLNKKPYIVVEGFVDSNIQTNNILENKYEKFTIMYAGGLYEKFGIYNLIKAVEQIKSDDIQLLLYGNGEMQEILEKDYKNNIKINYKGVAENDKIVEEEMKATLLINPRFTDEEYTKYSFPSKNMEYMASGTPVLTTKLPGMPQEYYDYVYLIEDETVEGMQNAIERLMNKEHKELFEKGLNAQEFVLKNKNNIFQGKKIIDFIKYIGRN